jgi:hypothetical protein
MTDTPTPTPDNNDSATFRYTVDMPRKTATALQAIADRHSITLAQLLTHGALALDKLDEVTAKNSALAARLEAVEKERDEAASVASYNAEYVDLVSEYKARAEAADAKLATAQQEIEDLRIIIDNSDTMIDEQSWIKSRAEVEALQAQPIPEIGER